MRSLLLLILFLILPVSAHASGCDSFAVLLAHMDGTDEGTTFTDENCSGAGAKTITANGNVNTETSTFKFATAAAEFDGSGDYLSLADSADWDIDSSGTYTVDFWYRTASVAEGYLIGQQDRSDLDNGGWAIFVRNPLDGNQFQVFIQDTLVIQVNHGLSADTWHHIAFERTATTAYIYRDGTLLASAANTSATSSSSALGVGAQLDNADRKYFNGFIDELRISKGVARYGGTGFTPETVPYSVDSNAAKFFQVL